MSRLIDADALIEELCGDCIGLMRNGECRFGKQCGDISFVRNAPTISPKTGRWIPVSERLPETAVLCCDNRGEMLIAYLYKDDESNTEYSAAMDDWYLTDVTAWMPLPEPYMEEVMK